jgi:hypothetical protein
LATGLQPFGGSQREGDGTSARLCNSNCAGLAGAHIRPTFLGRALSNWSRELKMETDLQLKDWVALLAVVVFAFAVLIVT